MKSLLFIVLLAAVASAAEFSNEELENAEGLVIPEGAEGAVSSDAFDVPEESVGISSRRNLVVGTIGPTDRLLTTRTIGRPGLPGQIQVHQERFDVFTRISSIIATEIGSQNPIPSIANGGIGSNFVTLRIQTAMGRGMAYNIQIWGGGR